ncbi:Acetylpolyamine aminohydrolase, partial [Tetrabaena socialis]
PQPPFTRQNILSARPDALYLSLHRDPKRFYPYTSGFLAEAGEAEGAGFNVNVPWLKKGMADGDYL